MARTTPGTDIPVPDSSDSRTVTADLWASFSKVGQLITQTSGESAAALSSATSAESKAALALARALAIEEPVHVGPSAPVDGEALWVDTDEDAPPTPVSVSSADITDATSVGRAVLTAPLSVDARNALAIYTGTRALLDAGTDTAERTWDAAELAGYVTDKVAAGGGAASWDDLTGKPKTFPPASHTHDDRYYTEAEVDQIIAAHPSLYRSGIRNIDGTLATGWAPATQGVRLSRQGATITLALDVTRVSALTSFADVVPIPAGFRPITSGYIQPAKASGGATGWYDRMGISTPLRLRLDSGQSMASGERLTNVLTWQTVDPIPTTLPGDPA